MKKAKIHRLMRKWHRYMGVILGVQFMAWTIGGLYFSWTKIEQIRGDDIRKESPPLTLGKDLVPPTQITRELQKNRLIERFESVQLINVLGKVYYQIVYKTDNKKYTQLADAESGILKEPLTRAEAVELAKSRLTKVAPVESVQYLTDANGHHEYREKPLPAYAIRFGGTVNTTVYVAAEQGSVQSFRNNQWRIFDFLWMLHTMDYQNRDNMNNWLLRIFSVFGLVTIASGFLLFFVSYRKKKDIQESTKKIPV
jgi:uncharacterized iron-regulated membrane protein